MNIRLIAMDLDDTLLNSRLELSRRSINAVRKAQAAGIVMTFATNRSFPASRPFMDPLRISGLLITYGGAQTREAESGKVVHEFVIEPALTAEVLSFAARHGVYAQVQRNDELLYLRACVWSEKYEAYARYRGQEAPWLAETPPSASKTMILAEPETVARLLPLAREHFKGKLWVTSSKPWFMELNHPEATKGSALRALAGILGIRREEIAAFGDHPVVDLEMIEFAGLGVAMGNAPQSLKDAADRVAPSNDEDGVAVVIEEILEHFNIENVEML
ncbi:MAG: Cof-type HAD-IIB family hydrolase [Deltaproteobacteria bacterium]|jgi:Cof subfamily protein (haloacid dehalogenase superfamily)|nr:Cof-type HAD-IIB family hydrolase [Deltaproteobacteria bacterium]